MKLNKKDGFKPNCGGVYKCQDCGKMTRRTSKNITNEYCIECEERQMHENNHADNNYPNDDCGDKNCPIKHYTKQQRWWIK